MSHIKLLVTGGSSQVGSALCARAVSAGINAVWFDDNILDSLTLKSIKAAIASHQPDYVINTVSYSVVDLAQDNPEKSHTYNHDVALLLAQACHSLNVPLVHLSTDYVFDGAQRSPYKEEAYTAPLNRFGEAKLAAEQAIKQYCPEHIIVRVGWIFSAQGHNFVLRTLRQLQEHHHVKAVSDQHGCPTYANDVARVLIAIIQQLDCGISVWGTYHYSGAEITTWKGFAEAILAAAKKHGVTQAENIDAVSSLEWPAKAPRPAYSVLDCSKILSTFGIRQRPWRSGLVKVIDQVFQTTQ
ncbi:MAG: dTDP-4-dehydrorhamnose reductase [Gammaproteobacteria bacterium]|nr:dTDP-4-dehydrorhamnose reductase [Gammaproteobacteria bacterium]